MLQFDEHSDGNKINLHVGEDFKIILHENPSTGYRWHLLSCGEPLCQLLDNSFELADGSPGNAGSHFWHFQAVNDGCGKIELAYRRSWEHATQPAQSFNLNIHVQA